MKIHYFMRKLCLSAVFAAVLISCYSCSVRSDYVSISGYAQGGTYIVKLGMGPEVRKHGIDASGIKAGIDSILLCIDNSISVYNKGSLLSRFNSGESIRPDSIFINMYDKSYGYYKMTGGAVDVAAAPLFDIWGFGFTSDSLPSPEKIRTVLAGTGMDRLADTLVTDSGGYTSAAMILKSCREASANASGTPDDVILPELNFNAIAQGYSCDLVAEYLHSLGVNQMLVDVGGEIYCEGFNPSGQPWGIGLDRPVDGNDTPGEDLQGIFRAGPEPCGVVTSGNYRKFYVRDGKKYAHTIDPKTGCPVTHSLLCATVIAGNATEADALATYCMVIGFEKARDFILSRPDLEGCLVYDEDGQMKTWTSPALDFLSK